MCAFMFVSRNEKASCGNFWSAGKISPSPLSAKPSSRGTADPLLGLLPNAGARRFSDKSTFRAAHGHCACGMEATTTLVHVSMDPELHKVAEAAVQAGLPADLVERLRVTGVRSDRDPENRAEHKILAATTLWQRRPTVSGALALPRKSKEARFTPKARRF